MSALPANVYEFPDADADTDEYVRPSPHLIEDDDHDDVEDREGDDIGGKFVDGFYVHDLEPLGEPEPIDDIEAPAAPWRCPPELRAKAPVIVPVGKQKYRTTKDADGKRIPVLVLDVRHLRETGERVMRKVPIPRRRRCDEDFPRCHVTYGTPACPEVLSESAEVAVNDQTLDAAWWRETLGPVAFKVEHYPQGMSTVTGLQDVQLVALCSAFATPAPVRVVRPKEVVVMLPGHTRPLLARVLPQSYDHQGAELPVYQLTQMSMQGLRTLLGVARRAVGGAP